MSNCSNPPKAGFGFLRAFLCALALAAVLPMAERAHAQSSSAALRDLRVVGVNSRDLLVQIHYSTDGASGCTSYIDPAKNGIPGRRCNGEARDVSIDTPESYSEIKLFFFSSGARHGVLTAPAQSSPPLPAFTETLTTLSQVVSLGVPLTKGIERVLTVTTTASDGTTMLVYTITVTRGRAASSAADDDAKLTRIDVFQPKSGGDILVARINYSTDGQTGCTDSGGAVYTCSGGAQDVSVGVPEEGSTEIYLQYTISHPGDPRTVRGAMSVLEQAEPTLAAVSDSEAITAGSVNSARVALTKGTERVLITTVTAHNGTTQLVYRVTITRAGVPPVANTTDATLTRIEIRVGDPGVIGLIGTAVVARIHYSTTGNEECTFAATPAPPTHTCTGGMRDVSVDTHEANPSIFLRYIVNHDADPRLVTGAMTVPAQSSPPLDAVNDLTAISEDSDFSDPVALSNGISRVLKTTVTAPDGTTTLVYRVTATRAARSTKTDLTITPEAASKVYGGSDPDIGYAAAGLIDGDGKADVFSAAPFERAAGDAAGEYAYQLKDPLPFAGAFASKYTVALAGGNAFTITRKPLVVEVTGASKVYDGGVAPPAARGSFAGSGALSGDDVAIVIGDYNNKNAAEAATLAVSLSGSDAANYTVNADVPASITKRVVTVDAVTLDKEYDGNAMTAGVSFGGGAVGNTADGESLTLRHTAESGEYDSANAGDGIDVSDAEFTLVAGARTNPANYALPSGIAVSGDIARKPVMVADDVALTKAYDGTANFGASSVSGGEITGEIDGQNLELQVSGGMYPGKVVGENLAITIPMSGFSLVSGNNSADPANYAPPASIAATGAITKFATTYTLTAAARVYDATDALGDTVSGAFSPALFGDDDVTINTASAVYADANAGEAKSITGAAAAGADLGNYEVTITARGEITKRRLRVTAAGSAEDAPSAAALADHSLLQDISVSASGEGLVGGHAFADVLMGSIALGTRDPAEGAGSAPLTQDTLALKAAAPGSNYTLTFTDGVFTFLAPETQEVIITPASPLTRVYGETAPASFRHTISLPADGTFFGGDNAQTDFFGGGNVLMLNAAADDGDVGNYQFELVSPLPASAAVLKSYVFVLDTGVQYTITPKTVTVAPVTLTKPYDRTNAADDAALSGGVVSGTVNGESLTLALADVVDDVYASVDAGDGIAITATGAQDFVLQSGDSGTTKPSNYALPAGISVTGVITAVAVQAAAVVLGKTYDGDDTFGASVIKSGGEVTGELGSQVLELRATGGTYSDADAGDGKTVSDPVFALASGDASTTKSANYALQAGTKATGDIARKGVTVVGDVVLTKTYDGDNAFGASAIKSGGVVSGAISGQMLQLNASAGVYSDANAGVGKTVDGAQFVLARGDSGATNPANYALPTGIKATGEITPKVVTVAPVVLTKTYDGDTAFGASSIKSGGAVSGAIDDEMLQLSATGGTYSTADAGDGKTVTTPTFALASNDASAMPANYALPAITVTGEITPKVVTVAPVMLTKTYDGGDTFGASVIKSGGAVSGTIDDQMLQLRASGSGVYDNANAGAGINVSGAMFTLVSADNSATPANYMLPSIAVTGDITRKSVTATNVSGASKTYDATDAKPSGIAAEFAAGGVVPADVGSVGIAFGAYDSANVANASTIEISLTGALADNYALTATTVPATITKRTLRVTASGSGGVAPSEATLEDHSLLTAGAATGEGLALDHTLTIVLTGKLAIGEKSGATADLKQGTLALKATALANNYTLVFTPGDYTFIQTLVITPIAPTLTRIYGEDAPAALSYSIAPNAESTYISGDNAETVFLTANPLTLPAGNSDAGEYDFVLISPVPVVPAKESLYKFTLAQDVKYTITPKEVAAAGVVLSKTYDGNDTFGASVIQSGGEVTGEITGEALRLTASGPATYENANAGAGKSVGGVVFALAGDNATTKPANYMLLAAGSITVTGEITVKRVTATADAGTAAKIYDAGVAAPPGIAATFDAGDIVSADAENDDKIRIVFGDYNSPNVADAATVGISLEGTSMGNYELTARTVAAVITKRTLRVSANNVVIAGEADRPAVADLTVRVGDAAGEGYASGEGAAEAFTGALAYGADADNTAPIEQGDLAATGNYEIASFTDGVLTIGIVFDADGSAGADATDGVLIARYLLGLRGDALIAGIKDDLETGATAESIATTLKAAVEATGSKYNVDGEGGVNAADGIMIARYFLGVTEGPGLTAGQTDVAHATVAKNIADTLPASQ